MALWFNIIKAFLKISFFALLENILISFRDDVFKRKMCQK